MRTSAFSQSPCHVLDSSFAKSSLPASIRRASASFFYSGDVAEILSGFRKDHDRERIVRIGRFALEHQQRAGREHGLDVLERAMGCACDVAFHEHNLADKWHERPVLSERAVHTRKQRGIN